MVTASPRRKQVSLGLVGTSAVWDADYRAAIRMLARYVTVRGVYDTVPARADQTAREWQAVVAPSLMSLYERTEIDAVILLENAWHGWFALNLACRFHKPTLITGPFRGTLADLDHWNLSARDAGVLLMAACPRRHTPATNRLRELMATRLGAPRAIHVDLCVPADAARDELINIIDWCSCVVGRAPTAAAVSQVTDADRDVVLSFSTSDITAQIQVRRSADATMTERLQVDGQHGSAWLTGPNDIGWKIGDEERQENLTSDRPSVNIIVDQFCRRVVGGLVPVPHLGDLLRSIRHAESAGYIWPA